MTEEFIKKAKEVKPIALIAEGTRIKDEPTNESEQLVYDKLYTVPNSGHLGMVFNSGHEINKNKSLIIKNF